MSLTQEERNTLVTLQLEKATKNLTQADDMLRMEYYDLAANRYYYACFHALQALMIRNERYCHTHAGLIGEFGKHFVRTGKVDAFYGRFIARLEQLREKGDYNCTYDITAEEAEEMKDPSHKLYDLICSMVV